MCGITGLYSFEPRPDRVGLHRIAQSMSNALTHRGPDSGDVWQDPDHPLVLAHRRLSIIDLSPAGAQPMASNSGRYALTYNGEIYNFKNLRTEIGNAYDFRGNSDSEVLLAAIETWGVQKAVKKIRGMFAFALWDRKAEALFFARDPMGKKPLYVGWAGSTLVFGSELKALCAHPGFNRDVDRASLTSFMRFGHVPAPLCIYKGVCQLLPGSMMALDMRMLRAGQDLKPLMEYYWSPKEALDVARSAPYEGADEVISNFENLLSECVADRMVSDVPLGAFLSGGIDSSTITAFMQKQSSAQIKTYSVGFGEAEYNEAAHARSVAAHLGTDHHEMMLSAKDAMDIVSQMPAMFDEPFADASALPTYLVSKFVRNNVTVALSGDGGDEILGGYVRHISGPRGWNIAQNHIPAPLRKPLAQIIQSISPKTWSRFRPDRPHFGTHLHKFADILTKQTEGDVYLSLVSTWKKPKSLVLDGREQIIPLVDPDMQIDGLNFPETMMYWDTLSYLNGDVLTKVDRASMAVGLEVRSPLLDTRIYDFVWRLPLEHKIHGKQGKWLLREVLKNHVPEYLFNRPKQGFSVPIGDWLRGDLKEWAEDLLDPYEIKAQGLLNYYEIEASWKRHQKGQGNEAQKLWTVLMFQAWHREWIGA